MEQKAIIVQDLVKEYPRVRAVDGVSFTVDKGEIFGLLGPNGAGKTTLVEMIEGIQNPDKGEIAIMGKRWKGNDSDDAGCNIRWSFVSGRCD